MTFKTRAQILLIYTAIEFDVELLLLKTMASIVSKLIGFSELAVIYFQRNINFKFNFLLSYGDDTPNLLPYPEANPDLTFPSLSVS